MVCKHMVQNTYQICCMRTCSAFSPPRNTTKLCRNKSFSRYVPPLSSDSCLSSASAAGAPTSDVKNWKKLACWGTLGSLDKHTRTESKHCSGRAVSNGLHPG
eukprot:1161843-Pelagomonas_calceolata.AAC.7